MSHYKLELVDLRKEFDGFVAVDDLNLVVGKGETVALLGPSGCGKSTTLNMIVGLEQPTSGDILIDGKSVLGTPPGKRKIGLVFQDYAVFTHMSVGANLAFGLKIKGAPRAKIREAVGRVAELLDLSDVLRKSPKQLGASELQRVAIGRTLVTEPEILLLDEPLSNLEVSLRNTVREQLRRMQAQMGQTIIYVTHDQIEALSLAHRIAVMNGGKLQQYDRCHDVYHVPFNTFVGSFLGSPPMNFFNGTLHHTRSGEVLVGEDATHIPLPANGLPRALPEGTHVTLGMRAEALRMVRHDHIGAFEARIILIEPRGPEKIITANLGVTEFRVVVPIHQAAKEDAVAYFACPPNRVALFDANSGVRLTTEKRVA